MELNGVINVYKEKGFTSHDAIAVLRGVLKVKKIGHTGTLDPDATGVLPVCVGKATKVAQMIMGSDKEYVAELVFGSETDTQDASGQVLKTYEYLRCGSGGRGSGFLSGRIRPGAAHVFGVEGRRHEAIRTGP